MILSCAAAVLALIACVCTFCFVLAYKDANSAPDGQSANPAAVQEEAAEVGQSGDEGATETPHEHDLQAVYEAVTVTPTETVHKEAVWGTEIEYHTLCNVCGEIVDGDPLGHSEATGHVGFTPEAPVEVDALISEEHDEEVAGEPVTTLEITGYVCSGCGETFPAPQAQG